MSLINNISFNTKLLALIFVSATFSCVAEKQSNPLNIVTEIAPPLQFFDGNQLDGKTTALVRQTIKHAQIEAKFNVFPWARAFQQALTSPNTLIYPIVRTPSRESQFIWIGKLLSFNIGIISLKNKKLRKINKLKQAKSLKIGVMRNDYVHQLLLNHGFKQNENFQVSSELSQLLTLLYAGKIDSMIADLPLLKIMAQSLGLDETQLVTTFIIPNQNVEVYLAANIDTPSNIIKRLKLGLSKSIATSH